LMRRPGQTSLRSTKHTMAYKGLIQGQRDKMAKHLQNNEGVCLLGRWPRFMTMALAICCHTEILRAICKRWKYALK